MKQPDDKVIQVTPDVKWIGVLDYDIKTFDIVMHTEFGTTYNSYFINARKKAIVEVAKEKFWDTYCSKLKSVTNPADIEYIIVDHTEPDHSGSLKHLLELAPSAIVVGSGNAIRYLEDIMNVPFKSMIVKDGDSLDLGNKTLKFISAPNLHWPDSIYSYLVEEKMLFTCDSFGAHYCSSELYSKFTEEYVGAFKYYFDVILRPFSRFMIKAIEKIRPLDINFICPGHGPIHSDEIRNAIELSEKFSLHYLSNSINRDKKNIFIGYVSAYGYTKSASELIAKGILSVTDVNVCITDIESISADELDEKLVTADAILVGSPTINQNTLLPVYKLFAHINPLRDKGKMGGAFGSYGWSGEASGIIIENLRLLKLNVFEEKAAFKFAPGVKKEDALINYGKEFAKKFSEYCK